MNNKKEEREKQITEIKMKNCREKDLQEKVSSHSRQEKIKGKEKENETEKGKEKDKEKIK